MMNVERNIFISLKQVLLPLTLHFISLSLLFLVFLRGNGNVYGYLGITIALTTMAVAYIRNNPDIKEKAIPLATFVGLMAGFVLAYIFVVIASQ
jgi:hypothetical protein